MVIVLVLQTESEGQGRRFEINACQKGNARAATTREATR